MPQTAGKTNFPELLLTGQRFCNSTEQTFQMQWSKCKSTSPKLLPLKSFGPRETSVGLNGVAFQKLSLLSAEAGARNVSHSCAHFSTQTLPVWAGARSADVHTFTLARCPPWSASHPTDQNAPLLPCSATCNPSCISHMGLTSHQALDNFHSSVLGSSRKHQLAQVKAEELRRGNNKASTAAVGNRKHDYCFACSYCKN